MPRGHHQSTRSSGAKTPTGWTRATKKAPEKQPSRSSGPKTPKSLTWPSKGDLVREDVRKAEEKARKEERRQREQDRNANKRSKEMSAVFGKTTSHNTEFNKQYPGFRKWIEDKKDKAKSAMPARPSMEHYHEMGKRHEAMKKAGPSMEHYYEMEKRHEAMKKAGRQLPARRHGETAAGPAQHLPPPPGENQRDGHQDVGGQRSSSASARTPEAGSVRGMGEGVVAGNVNRLETLEQVPFGGSALGQ